MWKPEADNQTLPPGVHPITQGDIKTLLGTDSVVEKVMRFIKDNEILQEVLIYSKSN